MSAGSITSSTSRRAPATNGVANVSAVLLDQLVALRLLILRLLDVAAEHDLDRSFGAHHRDLGRRPGEDLVRPEVLRAHRDVSPAICFAQHHRQLRHGRSRIGEQRLCAMPDNPAVFLLHARHEARHIHQRDHRNVECVAEPDVPRDLVRRVDVHRSAEHHRLVGQNADRVAVQVRESDHHVRSVAGLHLQEIGLVHQARDHLPHVVGLLADRLG